MKVKFILPALLEATDPGFRPIKYALFPPLGLAPLAGYLDPDDEAMLEDEHVMPLDARRRPDFVVMSVYITSAKRAYQLAAHYRAMGSHVALGGLHVSSMPDEAAAPRRHHLHRPRARTRGPRFLADFRRGEPQPRYVSQRRTLDDAPPIRRDLIDRAALPVPELDRRLARLPHHCDFCYKDAFYKGGISFYTQTVDRALAEIERMPGPARLLPRRPPARQRALRVGAVRRHARHGPGLPGGEHGRRDPAVRPDRAGRRAPACAACSSVSRRSIRRTCDCTRSARTCRATTTRSSAASTTSGS